MSFLPRIQSVLYSVFDLRQGPKIVFQVPEGLIGTQPGANCVLFHFDEISKYVIPPSALCGRLVTCATKRHRIIGFPVELRGKYERNYWRYNLCFVFDRDADLSCYEPIVRKVSRVLSACEQESSFLSDPTTSLAIHAILEQLYEDLNSYSETSIPIDHFNSIELKIFPFYPNPPEVHDYSVAVPLINLTKRIEPNWDLTMVKVCQHIDGANHVARIAVKTECALPLVRQAISHLLSYQVIMTSDIFQYSNMYMLRPSIQWLADESHVKEECGPYVTKPRHTIPHWPKLLHLYSRMKSGRTISEWMEEYHVEDLGIDVRRFTSFGVIKGFLRRVHRYPYLHPSPPEDPTLNPLDGSILVPPSLFTHPNFSIRKRVGSFSNAISSIATMSAARSPVLPDFIPRIRGRSPHPLNNPLSPEQGIASVPVTPTLPQSADVLPVAIAPIGSRPRRTSAAEVLHQVTIRDRRSSLLAIGGAAGVVPRTVLSSDGPMTTGLIPNIAETTSLPNNEPPDYSSSLVAHPIRRQSRVWMSNVLSSPSPNSSNTLAVASSGGPGLLTGSFQHGLRPRLSRSPSAPAHVHQGTDTRDGHGRVSDNVNPPLNTTNTDSANYGPILFSTAPAAPEVGLNITRVASPIPPVPTSLAALLDGEHHTDEICVKFGAGWNVVEQWLVIIGGGNIGPTGEVNYGSVSVFFH